MNNIKSIKLSILNLKYLFLIIPVLISILVIIGWILKITSLITISENFVPMQFNTAFCFLLSSLGIILISANKKKIALPIILISTLIALITLLQYILNSKFGIDQIFIQHYIITKTSHIGRMAPNTAISFILLGVTSLILTRKDNGKNKYIEWTASIISATGWLSLLGYIFNIPKAFAWGNLTGMALHTSLNFIFLGYACILANTKSKEFITFKKLKVPFIISILTIAVFLKIWVDTENKSNLSKVILERGSSIADRISENISSSISTTYRLGKLLQLSPLPEGNINIEYVKEVYSGIKFLQSLYILESDGQYLKNKFPPFGKTFPELLSRDYKKIPLSDFPITWIDKHRQQLQLISTVLNQVTGKNIYIVAILDFKKFFKKKNFENFEITISIENIEVFNSYKLKGAKRKASIEDWSNQIHFNINNTKSTLVINPTPTFFNRFDSLLSNIILISGFFISVLFLIMSYIYIKNSTLLDEVKYKTEYLKSTLAEIPSAILSINSKQEIIEFNQAAIELFEYKKEEVIGKNISILVPDSIKNDHPNLVESYFKNPETRRMSDRINLFGKTKTGKQFPVEIGLRPIFNKGFDLTVIASVIDLTFQKENERLILENSKQLKKSNRELEQFAYVASHDLKAPIRHISTHLEIIQNSLKEKLKDEEKESFYYIISATKKIKTLIDDLLKLSQVTEKKLNINNVSLNKVLDDVLDVLGLSISEKNSKIISEDLPTLYVDRGLFFQLFMNLLQNSLKYQKKDQELEIKISYRLVGKLHEISIVDNGIGFNPKYKKIIFDTFKRLHPDSRYQGSGIGLSLCKKIVELHGGEIWANSKVGKGAKITFTIPSHYKIKHIKES